LVLFQNNYFRKACDGTNKWLRRNSEANYLSLDKSTPTPWSGRRKRCYQLHRISEPWTYCDATLRLRFRAG